MSWLKKISQKSMPLPFDFDYYEDYDAGVYKVNDFMNQETADKMKEEHQPEYLGSGYHGVAVAPSGDANTVIKITNRVDELSIALMQMELDLPYLVRIHQVEKIQDNPAMWAIYADRVKTLNEQEKNLYDNFEYYAYTNKNNKDKAIKEFFYWVEKAHEGDEAQEDLGITFSNTKEIEEKLNKFFDFYQSMWYNNEGFYSQDSHGNNVGFAPSGNLVLFDFGHSEIS